MSRDLSPEVLSGLKTKYNSDRTAKAVRRALNKTDIMEESIFMSTPPGKPYRKTKPMSSPISRSILKL